MIRTILIGALLALVPLIAEARTLEDLLVEKGVLTKAEAGSISTENVSKVYWRGGTRMDFPAQAFSTQINTMLRARYEFTDRDEDAGRENSSSFDVVRARLIVSGNALDGQFSYLFQTEFAGDARDGEKSPDLLDAFVAWHPDKRISIRFGQSKVPFNRQFNAHEAKLQFPERSTASNYFNLGWQAGLLSTATLVDERLWASAGIYNGRSDGEGRNRSGVDTKHTGVATLRWTPLGAMDVYSEGDLEWTDDPALSFGGAYAYSESANEAGGMLSDNDFDELSVDANFKWRGWSAHAELYYRKVDPRASGSEEIEPMGFYAQAGWFVAPKLFEVALRYSHIDCEGGRAPGLCAGSEELNAISSTFNYYFWANHLKAQLGYEHLQEDSGAADRRTNRWIFQMSGYY